MKQLFGKQIFTELNEKTAPEHTALLIVDMQNDFCAEGGMIERIGGDISVVRSIIPNLQKVIRSARSAGVMVVYIRNRSRADGKYNAPADLARRLLSYAPEQDLLITKEGSWGELIVDELQPQPEDVTVFKHRPDAFERTQLSLILRSNGIKTVVVTGTATFACVESTARRALMEDFYVQVIEDCAASTDAGLHNASIEVMKAFFGEDSICTCSDITSAWSEKRVTADRAAETV